MVPGKVWLDVGCGHQVFAEWMKKEQAEVVGSCKVACGIDVDWVGLKAHPDIRNRVFGDLTDLPFESASLDLVSANMVAEHLDKPEGILTEIYRVLKPNGAFIFHTPNSLGWAIQIASRIPDALKKKLIWFLERRRAEDVFQTHYRMNTPSAIRGLAARSNFVVEDITMVSSSAATIMLGPVAWIELLYIRYLQNPKRAKFRSNIVAVLRKEADERFM